MQGRQACCSFQQTCIEFVGDSFVGHGDTSEHKPVLMQLIAEPIADECFTGYMRRGQGSIKHFCCACVCVCVCVCVCGLDWRVCEEMVHVSCAHPNSCSGDRSVCSVRVMRKWEQVYFWVCGEVGRPVTSLFPGLCGRPVVPGVHV